MIYWDSNTDKYMLKWIAAGDHTEREKIYKLHLHHPISKICNGLYNRHKENYKTRASDTHETNDLISFVYLTVLPKVKVIEGGGNVFGYITKSVQQYIYTMINRKLNRDNNLFDPLNTKNSITIYCLNKSEEDIITKRYDGEHLGKEMINRLEKYKQNGYITVNRTVDCKSIKNNTIINGLIDTINNRVDVDSAKDLKSYIVKNYDVSFHTVEQILRKTRRV